jgi:signal transduction histidine kinase
MQPHPESPVDPPPGRTTVLGRDPWVAGATLGVVLALLAGLADTVFSSDGDHTRLVVLLVIGAVGLLCALRDNALAAVVAAVLVAAEVRDPAPEGTWAVAGGLLLLLALRRPRLEAIAAGVLFALAGVLADIPWSEGVLGAGAFGLMTLAAAMVAVGQWVQAQRRYVVAELGRRQEEAERRRQEVTRHVVEERLRISRDLHDSVAHHFAVVSVQTTLARAQLATSPSAADRSLQNVQTAARSALEELQLLLGVLRDEPEAAPPDVGTGSVRALVASYRQTGLDVESAGTELFAQLPAPARAAVYRVLQEALTNAHRYGDGAATVGLTAAERHVELTVRNAIGTSAVAAAAGGGRGLTGMRERIGALGGTLHAGPEGRDFVVRARVPRAPSSPVDAGLAGAEPAA